MNIELANEADRLPERADLQPRETGEGNHARTLILPGKYEHPPDSEATWESRAGLKDAQVGLEVVLEVAGIKSGTILADSQALPAEAEGLLLEHRELPLCSELEITLTADDHEVIREHFIIPTARRAEVIEAHRKLGEISEEFITDAHKRDLAMMVYHPEMSEEVDVWFRMRVDKNHLLTYSVHIGPSHRQEIKKKISGQLQL